MTEKSFFNRLGLILTIYIGLWIGLQLVLAFLIDAFAPNAWDMEWVFWVASMAPMYFVAFPVALRMLKKLPRRELYKYKLNPGHFIQLLCMAIAVMLIGNIIGIIITTVLTNVTPWNFTADSTDLILNHGLGWIFLITVVIAPIIEEVLFRKALIDRLVVFGDVTAILVSALLFGFIHGNFSQLFYATGLGIVFGFVYVRTGKIKYTIGLHMLFNFMGGFVPALFLRKLDFLSMEGPLMHGDLSVIFDNIGALFGFVGYEMAIFGLGIAGFILLIYHRKKFKVYEGELQLSKREVAKQFFTTPGMLIMLVAIVVLFVLNVVGV